MEAVMISIKPKWVEKIANGEKTIEVRKTRPKLETPFKVYIYCTKDKNYKIAPFQFAEGWKVKKYDDATTYAGGCSWRTSGDLNGKVIGEFVCDRIIGVSIDGLAIFNMQTGNHIEKETCLTRDEAWEYLSNSLLTYKIGYGWHISELKIYDKPKEISEFYRPCMFEASCYLCDKSGYAPDMNIDCFNVITRPPQSWCYVEELKGEK